MQENKEIRFPETFREKMEYLKKEKHYDPDFLMLLDMIEFIVQQYDDHTHKPQGYLE